MLNCIHVHTAPPYKKVSRSAKDTRHSPRQYDISAPPWYRYVLFTVYDTIIEHLRFDGYNEPDPPLYNEMGPVLHSFLSCCNVLIFMTLPRKVSVFSCLHAA